MYKTFKENILLPLSLHNINEKERYCNKNSGESYKQLG